MCAGRVCVGRVCVCVPAYTSVLLVGRRVWVLGESAPVVAYSLGSENASSWEAAWPCRGHCAALLQLEEGEMIRLVSLQVLTLGCPYPTEG